eukprot:5593110-Karenia_brevis.AAC.1
MMTAKILRAGLVTPSSHGPASLRWQIIQGHQSFQQLTKPSQLAVSPSMYERTNASIALKCEVEIRFQ